MIDVRFPSFISQPLIACSVHQPVNLSAMYYENQVTCSASSNHKHLKTPIKMLISAMIYSFDMLTDHHHQVYKDIVTSDKAIAAHNLQVDTRSRLTPLP